MTGIDKRLPRTGFQKFQSLDWSQDTGPSVQIQAHWVMLTPLKLGGQGLACFSNLPHSVCFMPNNSKHSSDPHSLASHPQHSPLSKWKSSSDMTFPRNLSWFLFPIEGNTPLGLRLYLTSASTVVPCCPGLIIYLPPSWAWEQGQGFLFVF